LDILSHLGTRACIKGWVWLRLQNQELSLRFGNNVRKAGLGLGLGMDATSKWS